MPSENQFRMALDPDECVRIADADVVRFGWALMALFFLNESPDFVTLNVVHFDVADVRLKQPFAVLASREHQVA